MDYLDKCYHLLPPRFRAIEREGSTMYVNDATGYLSSVHPVDRYKELVGIVAPEAVVASSGQVEMGDNDAGIVNDEACADDPQDATSRVPRDVTFSCDSLPATPQTQPPPMTPASTRSQSGPHLLDYHCEWKERNAQGQSTMLGLTLRYNLQDNTTSIRFDGVPDSEWTFTAIKGPYGVLDQHDLYVGAKVDVFGRHLTIAHANSAAVKWIDNEANRLSKLQAKFRRKIESIGQKPVIVGKEQGVVRHVERSTKKAGQVNLRKMMSDTAKLGEQLAQLGLSEYAAM